MAVRERHRRPKLGEVNYPAALPPAVLQATAVTGLPIAVQAIRVLVPGLGIDAGQSTTTTLVLPRMLTPTVDRR